MWLLLPIRADRELADFAAAVRDGRLQRLAIANPEHPPYGRAEREVLEQRGLWLALQGRLAQGGNAAQAAQLAVSGATQPLVFQVSSHTMVRIGLAPRRMASVSLLAERIHLMPVE